MMGVPIPAETGCGQECNGTEQEQYPTTPRSVAPLQYRQRSVGNREVCGLALKVGVKGMRRRQQSMCNRDVCGGLADGLNRLADALGNILERLISIGPLGHRSRISGESL